MHSAPLIKLLHARNALQIVGSFNSKTAKQAADRLRAELHRTKTCAIGLKIDFNEVQTLEPAPELPSDRRAGY